jgi:hypothetical protein
MFTWINKGSELHAPFEITLALKTKQFSTMTSSKSTIYSAIRWLEEYQEREYARRGETPTIHEEMLDPYSLRDHFDRDTVHEYNEILRLFPGSKYDSPIARFDLCKILHYIRDKDPRPTKPSIVVGTSPSLVPNACIALMRDASVIVHNGGFTVFFTFAIAALARLIELPDPISSAPLDQLSKRAKRSKARHDRRSGAVVANGPTTCGVRHHTPLIHRPLHRRSTRCCGSFQISLLTRGSQIPIAPAARPYVPLSAVSSLGGFRTPAADLVVPSLMRPASETLHNRRHRWLGLLQLLKLPSQRPTMCSNELERTFHTISRI